MMNESDPQDSQLLREFSNPNDEEIYIIKRDFYIEKDKIMRHETSPNPNQHIRIVRQIFDNYIQLIRSVRIMHQFLIKYRKTLLYDLCIKNLKALESIQRDGPLDNQQQLELETIRTLLQQPYQPDPDQPFQALIIKHITPLKEREEKQAISNAINKLKLMVAKARYKQSTKLEHLTETYVVKLREALNCHVKHHIGQRTNIVSMHSQRNQFILQALRAIKIRFDFLQLSQLKHRKIQPHAYLQALRKDLKEKPIFFVNFFTEPLLFLDNQYIGFDENLLYCPIIISDQSVKISNEYFNYLSISSAEWTQFQVYLQIFHIETSNTEPIFYSKLNAKQQKFDIPYDIDSQKKISVQKLQELMVKLTTIRKFVFGRMLFNWLAQIFFQGEAQIITMTIQQKFRVAIRISSELTFYEKKSFRGRVPQFKPELITNLLLLAGQHKNVERGRKQVLESVQSLLQAMVFKLIAEASGSKVSWTLDSGSLGEHYYQYNYDRVLHRNEVKKMFNNF